MSIKIALIYPHIIGGTTLPIEKAPESIQILAGQLENEGHTVQMFNERIGKDLYAKIAQFNPNYVGISTMTANFLEGKKVAKAVKSINPMVPVILGGWHVSGVVASYLNNQESETIKEILNPESPFDFVVAGEGDLVLPELISRLNNGEKITGLKGVGYFNNGNIKVSIADRVKNLDKLADPSWNGLPVKRYRSKRTGKLDLSVHFNRGCRNACAFCSNSSVYGKGVITMSTKRAVDYVESILERFNPEIITFTDEDFFANLKWVAEIVRVFIERDFHGRYGVTFDTFASINDLHRLEKRGKGDLLDKLKEAGFYSFTVGVESLDSEVLRKYNKELNIIQTMTKEQRDLYLQCSQKEQDIMLASHYLKSVQNAINFAQQHGIFIIGDYILGNLGESEEKVKKGFEKFSSLKNLYFAYLPIFTPFPGTGLWKEAYDSGKLIRDSEGKIDWSRFDATTGCLDLDYNIEELRNTFELEFYICDSYQSDMFAEIQREPSSVSEFRGRFNHLSNIFPDNKKVETILKQLDKFNTPNSSSH